MDLVRGEACRRRRRKRGTSLPLIPPLFVAVMPLFVAAALFTVLLHPKWSHVLGPPCLLLALALAPLMLAGRRDNNCHFISFSAVIASRARHSGAPLAGDSKHW